jgi:hypothetical protein
MKWEGMMGERNILDSRSVLRRSLAIGRTERKPMQLQPREQRVIIKINVQQFRSAQWDPPGVLSQVVLNHPILSLSISLLLLLYNRPAPADWPKRAMSFIVIFFSWFWGLAGSAGWLSLAVAHEAVVRW